MESKRIEIPGDAIPVEVKASPTVARFKLKHVLRDKMASFIKDPGQKHSGRHLQLLTATYVLDAIMGEGAKDDILLDEALLTIKGWKDGFRPNEYVLVEISKV